MYICLEFILEAIKRLKRVHPFFGITFLSCKQNDLPVGGQVAFSMDEKTRRFMDLNHRLYPQSEWYFQPYTSNMREKQWVTSKYPSSGLQAINTQTFGQVFIHSKKEKLWGWDKNYIEFLSRFLAGQRIPIIDLAIWFFKKENFLNDITLTDIIEQFISCFKITTNEKESLFDFQIEGYSSANLLQEKPVTWNDLQRYFLPPPDASPNRGATLSYLKIDNIGPTSSIMMELGSRLNIITGDNGLGKSFLMECIWWALTGTWPEVPAYPRKTKNGLPSKITYGLDSGNGIISKNTVNFDTKLAVWPRDKKSPTIPGLIIYARVDGSYAVWDPAKQYDPNKKDQAFVFDHNQVWDGMPGNIEGLVRDWVKWQSIPDKYPFDILKQVLEKVSPPDIGFLRPGHPVRIIGDIREIPTIIHPYGEVPIIHASAGVRRILTLAYLIVWTWNEHKIVSELSKTNPEKRMVIIIDELEAHLHPKWQRVILPALLKLDTLIYSELKVQFILSTHSPLVLASTESYYDESSDRLFHIDVNKETGEAELTDINYIKYGEIDSWLMSPLFNLTQARAQEAEKIIERAKALQLQKRASQEEVFEVHKELTIVLSETDPFWPRWIYFAEQHGVET